MTEGAEILLPTPMIFPPMIGPVEVGSYSLRVDIASPDASVVAVATHPPMLRRTLGQAARVERRQARHLEHLPDHHSVALQAECRRHPRSVTPRQRAGSRSASSTNQNLLRCSPPTIRTNQTPKKSRRLKMKTSRRRRSTLLPGAVAGQRRCRRA